MPASAKKALNLFNFGKVTDQKCPINDANFKVNLARAF